LLTASAAEMCIAKYERSTIATKKIAEKILKRKKFQEYLFKYKYSPRLLKI